MAQRLISIGECMIEMSGGENRMYRLGYAGDTLNMIWYARARLPAEWEVDYFTALGDDIYSEEMAGFIAAAGIGTDAIRRIPGKRAGLYLIHQAHGDRQFTYWRGQSAAKQLADDAEALDAALSGAALIYFSGITMAILSPRARGKLMAAIVRARDAGARVAFDPNERPALWTSTSIMASCLTAAASIADVVLPTHGDEAELFGDASPDATADRYLSLGVEEVVVKNGAAAAIVATASERHGVAPGAAGEVVDATGAGDSFAGAYLAARLTGASPADAARAAHRVAGIVIGHKGALIDPGLVR
jgi:2-dehydro-3-deoxygluconokinase